MAIILGIAFVVFLALGRLAFLSLAKAIHRPMVVTPSQLLSAQKNYITKAIRSGWLWWPLAFAIVGVVGLGIYSKIDLSSSPAPSPSSTTVPFKVILQPGKPVEVVMPPGWRLDWWGNSDKFESHAVWRGPNKVRIFSTKAGFEEVELTFHLYRCSASAPC